MTLFKKMVVLSFALFAHNFLNAQNASKVQRAKEEMDQAIQRIDSLKNSADPAVAREARRMEKVLNNVKKQAGQQFDVLQHHANKAGADLPVAHPAHRLDLIEKPNITVIKTIAKAVIAEAVPNLDLIRKKNLDDILQDTTINASATAMMMMANGVFKADGGYLIGHDVNDHPSDPWKLNDMGALLRDNGNLDDALKCFQFADGFLHSVIIINNVAWTCYYYGDFQESKQYFDAALAIEPNYRSALEGRALIAFQEGDTKALFACLVKEITEMGIFSGLTPSEPFESVWSQEASKQNDIDYDHQPDPTVINTFDHVGDDGAQQNSPPGADSDPVDYPDYRSIFQYHPGNMQAALAEGLRFIAVAMPRETTKAINAPKALVAKLPPLVTQVDDSAGVKVIHRNFKLFVDLYEQNEHLFDRRIFWYKRKCEADLQLLARSIQSTGQTLVNQLIATPPDKQCPIRATMAKTGIADATIVGVTWMKYFAKIAQECATFNKSSSKFITRVHEPNWNRYLNAKRESIIRRAVLLFYNIYANAMKSSSAMFGFTDAYLHEDCPPTEALLMSDGASAGPDPYSQKVKKIQTFVEPCYASNTELTVPGIVTLSFGCTSDKLSIGSALSGFVEHVHDRKYVGDNYWHTGLSLGLSRGVSGEQQIGTMKAGAEAKIGMEGTVYYDFDASAHCIKKGISISASATAGESLSIGGTTSAKDVNVKEHYGVGAGIEIYSQLGQNPPAGYQTQLSGGITR